MTKQEKHAIGTSSLKNSREPSTILITVRRQIKIVIGTGAHTSHSFTETYKLKAFCQEIGKMKYKNVRY